MPTRKIADLPKEKKCRDPNHQVPNMMVFDKGAAFLLHLKVKESCRYTYEVNV